jgi:hypothetical protein
MRKTEFVYSGTVGTVETAEIDDVDARHRIQPMEEADYRRMQLHLEKPDVLL